MNRQQRRKMERGSKKKGVINFVIALEKFNDRIEILEVVRMDENPDKLKYHSI